MGIISQLRDTSEMNIEISKLTYFYAKILYLH